MANRLNPTAANIISSLGVKGATVSEPLEGYVPVLGPDGKLNVEFIPDSAARMSVPPVSDVAFVDPYTTETNQNLRNGSVAAPYNSISEAASRFGYGETVALVLAPGTYSNEGIVEFRPNATLIYLIGTGMCSFGNLSIRVGSGVSLTVQNIRVLNTMSVSSGTVISLVGNTSITEISSEGSSLKMSSGSRVDSTNIVDITLSSDARHISNTSTVEGQTVEDALTRLDGRKIRVLHIDAGNSGLDVGSSYVEVDAESSGSYDVYDLRSRDEAIVSAIGELFRRSRHVEAEDVTAGTVSANAISTRALSIDALRLGGYNIEVDAYGYLVVGNGSASPVRPTAGTILLRDSVTGGLWMIYVENGRLYVERYYEDSSDSSSPQYDEYDFIELVDALDTYRVSMSNGRLVIDDGSSS